MNIEYLQDYYLVGGTALALQFGHRISIDLDLFSSNLESYGLSNELRNRFGDRFRREQTPQDWAVFGFLDDIKVDFVRYDHALLDTPILDEGIRMYSLKDIAAMKINAILGRGTKKDFWDVFQLLEVFSLEEIISFHSKKFPNQQLLISIPQALVYFEDANKSVDPISLKGQNWDQVKGFISEKVREFLS